MARPPIAQQRLRINKQGQVVYEFKRPFRDGSSAVVFAPETFIEKLCALVPPPQTHLVTYHGVLPGAGSVVAFNGARLEIHADVSLSLPSSLKISIKARDGRPKLASHAGKERLVDGKVLDIRDGRLLTGGVDHGEVSRGDVVRIDGRGVLVNDARRPAGAPPADREG